jgi:hypothetical protein
METRREMKLYHGRYILPALGAFLVVVTFPVWRGMASRAPEFKSPPNPKGERCIEPKSFMRAQHMQMLGRWRDEVVREDRRIYFARDGRAWEKSLKTCVGCHGHTDAQGKSTTAAAACTDCHNYVSAKLDCWNCHHESAPDAVKVAAGDAGDRPNASAVAQVSNLRYEPRAVAKEGNAHPTISEEARR